MSTADISLSDQHFLEALVVACEVAGVLPQELANAGTSTFISTEPGIKAIEVKVNTGHADGLRQRFAVENNANQPTVDVNFRGANVNIGDTQASSSAVGTQLASYKPTGDTSQHVTWYKPGSSTIAATYIGPNGQVVIQAGGLITTALAVKTAGDSQNAYELQATGRMDWGTGGSTATDVTLARTTTSTMTLTGSLIVNGNIGFFNHAAAAKPTVTGSRGGNAALASLLTGLAGLGLITDSTSA